MGISRRIDQLYNKMVENNLIKIISPFSCVEISHISHLIKLPVADVEKKLAHMILDRKFSGILDQGQGTLVVYDNESENANFQLGLDVIKNMGHVVEAMKGRGNRLTQLKNVDGAKKGSDE